MSGHSPPPRESQALSIAEINALIGDRVGQFDVTCPICSPQRRRINQHRRTLRIWRQTDGFATYKCAHCDARGYAHGGGACLDDHAIAQARERRDERDRGLIEMSRNRARALWCESKPIEGSPAETYLRECRGYAGELQPTLAYLPPLHGYPTATIAAFGMPREVAEGVLAIDPADVVGVHLTLLKIDGLGKAATGNDKLTLGKGHDAPIILAPPTDMMSLVIAEGIEDALSAHQALGCGAWAAGSVSRLPAMADHVPEFIESVVILVDVDRDGTGEKYSAQLAERLSNRGIETRLLMGPPDGCE